MKKMVLALMLLVFFLSSCTSAASTDKVSNEVAGDSPADTSAPNSANVDSSSNTDDRAQVADVALAGEVFTTYVESDGIGNIAMQISLPDQARYADGAAIVVEVNTFLTPKNDFYQSVDANAIGLIHISYLWPGVTSSSGAASDGAQDYGGENSIQALRDVILFALGERPNYEGFFLDELIEPSPLFDNVGLYAFSHPGLAAVNVLALYGEEISALRYFVGRENPTMDKLTAVELGHFSPENRPVLNPQYVYPDQYRANEILIDYSAIAWDATYTEGGANWEGGPYWDFNGNGQPDGSDHILGLRVPAINSQRLYSVELMEALQSNGALDASNWPDDLASVNTARDYWPFQDSTTRYPRIGQAMPELKVMLVFARFDHVQPLLDKPHIHQAFEGFRFAAKLWVRLNPDQVYIAALDADFGAEYDDNPARKQPLNWMDVEDWGYPNFPGASQVAPLAAIAEMADRSRDDLWSEDLNETLYSY